MAFQTIFKRYELKYMLTKEQKEKIVKLILPYMKPDNYGKTTIRNIYYDTENFQLIRRSIEKPAYKEKLRIRSYSHTSSNSIVFVELKKKYDNVVYKRRIPLCEDEAMLWLDKKIGCPNDTQVSREINYFIDFYGELKQVIFLSYEREAYYSINDDNFRVTFDENILCRQNEINFYSNIYGTPILSEGMVLMELKCSGGIPLWMVEILSRERIYKTSFSKYGMAYKTLIFPKIYKKFKEKENIING